MSEMKDLPFPKYSNSTLKGSMKEKGFKDWTDKIIDGPMRMSSTLITGEKISWKECYEERCYGFDEALYPDFLKLVKTIEKDKSVNSLVSLDFLLKKCFNWFVDTYKNQRAKSNLSDFILLEIRDSIKEYVIQFPVLYLDIEKFIDVGKTRIAYYTQEFLEQLEKKFLNKNPNRKNNNPYEAIKKEFQGEVIISYRVKAEKGKAKQIAYEECSLAIDTLKLCSITTDVPNYRLSFNIDSRTTENLANKIIYVESSKPDEFILDAFTIPNDYKIDEKEFNLILQRRLNNFHIFLLNKDKFDTELKRIIVNSIKKYASAISNIDLNQRIVDLFTILESLLLKDENVAIIESVCKYCSKLVFKKIEDRKYSISLLKKMYSIRSAMVHHANRKEFEMDELRKLQVIVLLLFTELIKRLETHETKNSILQEIDDEILKAY